MQSDERGSRSNMRGPDPFVSYHLTVSGSYTNTATCFPHMLTTIEHACEAVKESDARTRVRTHTRTHTF